MRLTLRTLLAYLDDTLDPIETKQIGQKVAESDSAQELIARIKQVTRRRRLTAPDDAGSTIKTVDANTVAEYLDNALSAEQVAQLEKTCLESDLHLAEVAACHQILTLILGEPARVPPPARQRMYGLVKGQEAIPERRPPVMRPPAAEQLSDAEEPAEGSLLALPLAAPKGAWLGRLARVAAVLVVVAGLILVLYQAIVREPVKSNPVMRQPRGGPSPVVHVTGADEMQLFGWVGALAAARPTLAAVPALPPDVLLCIGEERATAETVETPEPVAELLPVPPREESVIRPARPRQPLMATKESLLFRRVGVNDWRWVRSRTPVAPGELLLSLPGFSSEISAGQALRIELVGNIMPGRFVFETAASFQETSDVDVDVVLERGRLVLVNLRDSHSPYLQALRATIAAGAAVAVPIPGSPLAMGAEVEAGAASPLASGSEAETLVRLRFHDQVWEIILLEPTTRLGLELPGRMTRAAGGTWMPRSVIRLWSSGGSVELRYDNRVERIPRGYLAHYDSGLPKDKLLLVAPQDIGLGDVPEWVRRQETLPNEARNAQEALQKRLAKKLDPKIDKEPPLIRLALREALAQTGPRYYWERAAALLSLGAMDELPAVVEALDDSERADVRDVAQTAILHWLSRQPDQEVHLRRAFLQRGYSEEDTSLVMRLLRGGEQPAFLLECLGHARLPVRQMAHVQLRTFIPPGQKEPPFDPAGLEDVRERQVDQWKARFPKP